MAKTTRVLMPQLGESVHEGTISKWLVKPGDKVVEFEPMLEVDTDKVNAEVPAPVTGILREILAKEGETVQAGAEIAGAERGSGGAVTATPEPPAPAAAVPAPQPPPHAEPTPPAWQRQEAEMPGAAANRAPPKPAFQKQEGSPLTYLPYVMAAAASALREHPQVNSTFNETELIIHRDINLGVSVGLEDTLVVPVVRRADGLSLAGLARAVNDIASRAKNKQLKADDLAGATFTVNNSGTFGTLFSYSVINPGQAGILTMEAIVDRPMAVNGMIGIKPMMYLCFSFDHRILDGLQAARFLTSCRKWLEAVTVESRIY